uniref:Tachykinin 4 n=1 Tax=Nomascus leucogenys TaxID=61853 RepID=A0A2I3HWN2_NOMLE
MLPCLTLLLLMELSVCTVAGDGGEEQTLSTEAETWITEGAGPSIQLQLQEVKTGKASHCNTRVSCPLLGKRNLSTEGREDEAQGSE